MPNKTSKKPGRPPRFPERRSRRRGRAGGEPGRSESAGSTGPAKGAATTLPSARLAAAESAPPPPRVDVYTTDRPGSDFMVDVIKTLGFEYVLRQSGVELPRAARIVRELRRTTRAPNC